MKLSEILKYLSGSTIIYATVWACTAASGTNSSDASSGGSVSIAHASEPIVAEEPCGSQGFAVHDFPGKSIVELSAVRVVVHGQYSGTPVDGFSDYTVDAYSQILLADGKVAASCSGPVKFILPQ